VRDGFGAIALGTGVGLLSQYAPAQGRGTSGARAWLITGAVLAALAVAPFVLRAAGRVAGPLWLAASVGFAFAMTGLSSEVVSRGIERRNVAVVAAAGAVTAAFGFVGFLTESSALVSGSVTAIVPVMIAVETVLPVGLAPVLFDERWPHGAFRIAALVCGLVGAVGGAVTLAGSPAVASARLGAGAVATPGAARGR
jgi:hypothetical protein